MNLVTGYRGSAHVTVNDMAAMNRAIFGDGAIVINTGNLFAASATDEGLSIADGEAVIQGHHVRIGPGDTEEIELDHCTSGNYRKDYIVIEIERGSTGIDSGAIVQVVGTAVTTNSAVFPNLQQDTITSSGTKYQLALYTLTWTGGSYAMAAAFTAVNDIYSLISGLSTSKQDSITGGASTIASSNLTTSRALISNSSGKVAVSAVTATELSYLDGVTSNIQTQFNSITAVLNGIGVHYFVGSSANLSSTWTFSLKKFDTYTSIDDALGNLTSAVTSGYWIPPKAGFFVANFLVRFASNSKGNRGAQMCIYDSDNNQTQTLTRMVVPAASQQQTITITAAGYLNPEKTSCKLGLEVAQNSGSTLAVYATARVLFIPNL